MEFKRVIFWAHLIAGVLAGIVVLWLSVTGVLLTYERQIVSWLEQGSVPAKGKTLSADQSVNVALEATDGKVSGVMFSRNSDAPVQAQIGRGTPQLLNPYSGDVLPRADGARELFRTVTHLHRWLALEGVGRDTAKAIIGAANLVFLFIVVSGLYLWLPRRWTWQMLKFNLFFRRNLPSARARDYNWHHVIGFWCLIPLFVIVATGAVFSYGWANQLVFAAYGEEAPVRGGPPGPAGRQSGKHQGKQLGHQAAPEPEANAALSLQDLLQRAKAYNDSWRTVTLQVPKADAPTVSFNIDTGTGGQPQKRDTVTFDRHSGEVVAMRTFADSSPGQQARVFIRFLHTGESLGAIGQTLAGLASLGACFLVYTGLALAYRRLLQPYIRRRKAAASAS